jgi:hypothetical protein
MQNSFRAAFLLIICLILVQLQLVGQHQEVNEKPAIWGKESEDSRDSSSILYALKSGKTQGHFRYFFSSTDNSGVLTDYYANAFGGGLRYESGKFHGFQLGTSGFYVFNIGSSDLAKVDSTTNQVNRYELGLFDIQNPANRNDIDRLEEFFLKYSYRNSFIRFGRQLINTPFINLQDGRMRPTSTEGLWFEFNEVKKLELSGGWIYAISPRSTAKWFRAAESVGVYAMGVSTNGKKSNYANQLQSDGVLMFGAKYKSKKWLTITTWDLLFENVMNTAFVQSDLEFSNKKNTTFLASFQAIRQDAINQGGNPDVDLTYIDQGAKSNAFGAKAGIRKGKVEFTLNYNRIFDSGRYLMPREWGRDPFFTFLSRERNDGLGDVHALVGKFAIILPKNGVKINIGGGYFKLPDVKNFRLNKYGLPSYSQLNIDARYEFKGVFKGLEGQLLYVMKFNQGETYNDLRYTFNKVDMSLLNVVLNYHF